MSRPTRVLFVCLGNICRSPLAEGVFRHLAEARGAGGRFEVDSAGTAAYHVGKPADPRSREVAARHGIRLTGTARKVRGDDYSRFDVILAMDGDNLATLRDRQPKGSAARVEMMRAYDPAGPGDVPDPYYGGPEGFDRVYEILERSCRALLDALAEDA